MKRITYTLSRKRRDKLMGQLEKHNNEIQTLLGNSERLEPMRKKRKSPVTKYFHQIRIQAQSLHTALTHAWQCKESSTHTARLLLEKRVKSDENGGHEIEDPTSIKFNVVFAHERQEYGSTSTLCSSSLDLYAAKIELIDQNTEFEQRDLLPSTAGNRPSLTETTSQHSSKIGSLATSTSNSEARTVSFAESNTEPTSLSVLDDAPEIVDLCSVLRRRSPQQSSVGYFKDPQQRRYILSLADDPQITYSNIEKVTNLDEVLGRKDETSGKPILTRKRRLAIAVVLAHSMLQLHTGPWLSHTWGKRDIYFLQDDNGLIYTEQPFLVRHFSKKPASTDTCPNESIFRGCNSSLLSLGILILELCLIERIESLPFYSKFQDAERKDKIYSFQYSTEMARASHGRGRSRLAQSHQAMHLLRVWCGKPRS